MRGTYRELVPFIERIYERHLAGCCWHVVTDDLNLAAETIESCADAAIENRDARADGESHDDCWALAIAWKSRRYSRTALRKAILVSDRRRRG